MLSGLIKPCISTTIILRLLLFWYYESTPSGCAPSNCCMIVTVKVVPEERGEGVVSLYDFTFPRSRNLIKLKKRNPSNSFVLTHKTYFISFLFLFRVICLIIILPYLVANCPSRQTV